MQKWGNSFALRIPKTFASELGLKQNSPIKLSLENGKLVIIPVITPKLTLEHLLSQVNKKNLHSEINTGPAAGKEVW
jgi:antitoxin MazE